LDLAERLIIAAMAVICAILLVIGWVSPPNNVDSLLYHMSRVVHWAENQSLRHYPTAYHHQLLKPIWAETAILNLRVLWGNDHPASLVQWFSMLGSLIGVTGIASLLGAGRKTRILASAIALSIPMGILQASSTQNDYVTAFWVICLAYLVVLSRKRPLARLEVLGLALVLGLGVLTKGPFFVYAPPLMLWYILPQLRPKNIRRLVVEGLVICLAVALLNAGFWTRNVITYGGPYGPSEWLQEMLGFQLPTAQVRTHPIAASLTGGVAKAARSSAFAVSTAQFLNPQGRELSTFTMEESPLYQRGDMTARLVPSRGFTDIILGWIQRVAETVAWNLVTPSSAVNHLLERGMLAMPRVFGLGPDFQELLKQAAWNHEDTAGNPVHLLLIPVALVGLAIAHRRGGGSLLLWYVLVTLATLGLVPVVIGHGYTIWGLRYQLPFFVLAAPIIAIGISLPQSRWMPMGVAGGFLVMSLPWVFLNNTRPIIGLPPWPTRIDSIFSVPPEDVLLAVDASSRHSYVAGAQAVEASGCTKVGLRLNSNDLEYAYWWMLDAPQSGFRLETIYTYPNLERYVDPTFKPCAIICMICGDRTQIHGLPRVMNSGRVSVFVGPNFVPEKGD
jgi:4-amino-4-deoxy-L-arabinose transferase-like glycosyltransferase